MIYDVRFIYDLAIWPFLGAKVLKKNDIHNLYVIFL